MRAPLGQFVFGFVIAFSPAPLVGFGTWSLVNAKDAKPTEATDAPGYGSPETREWHHDSRVQMRQDGVYLPEDQRQEAQAPRQQMEIETDCAKRKKRKQIEKRPKPEREIPDL